MSLKCRNRGVWGVFRTVPYGTGVPTPGLTTFWLEGNLKISAVEQVDFMKRVYRLELLFSVASYELLRQIMVVEKTSEAVLLAKKTDRRSAKSIPSA